LNKRLLIKSSNILEDLSKSRYYVFIRAKGFETVGILTKIDHVYDGSWGVMRQLAMGLSFSGEPFEEYLDRKNKRTGELEELIQMQTDLLIITARDTNNPDDDENNFTYLLDANTSNNIKDKLDETVELRRINNVLNKKIEESVRMRDSFMRQLETAQSEANSYREKMSNFAEQLGQARARAEYYQQQLKSQHAVTLEKEGFLSEKMKGATYLGELQGKDSADLIFEAAQKQVKAKTELDKIIGPVDTVNRDDFQRFEKQVFEKIDTKQTLSNNAKKTKEIVEESKED